MSEKERVVVVDSAFPVVEIGVADAARLNGNDGLTRSGIRDHDGLDRDRRLLGPCDDSSNLLCHVTLLCAVDLEPAGRI